MVLKRLFDSIKGHKKVIQEPEVIMPKAEPEEKPKSKGKKPLQPVED